LATQADVIAVKIWDDSEVGGYLSDAIEAIKWIMEVVEHSGRPSIANLSWTVPHDDQLSEAANAAIQAGIHFAGSAGNRPQEASLRFPGASE
jgi:Subtilase family